MTTAVNPAFEALTTQLHEARNMTALALMQYSAAIKRGEVGLDRDAFVEAWNGADSYRPVLAAALGTSEEVIRDFGFKVVGPDGRSFANNTMATRDSAWGSLVSYLDQGGLACEPFVMAKHSAPRYGDKGRAEVTKAKEEELFQFVLHQLDDIEGNPVPVARIRSTVIGMLKRAMRPDVLPVPITPAELQTRCRKVALKAASEMHKDPNAGWITETHAVCDAVVAEMAMLDKAGKLFGGARRLTGIDGWGSAAAVVTGAPTGLAHVGAGGSGQGPVAPPEKTDPTTEPDATLNRDDVDEFAAALTHLRGNRNPSPMQMNAMERILAFCAKLMGDQLRKTHVEAARHLPSPMDQHRAAQETLERAFAANTYQTKEEEAAALAKALGVDPNHFQDVIARMEAEAAAKRRTDKTETPTTEQVQAEDDLRKALGPWLPTPGMAGTDFYPDSSARFLFQTGETEPSGSRIEVRVTHCTHGPASRPVYTVVDKDGKHYQAFADELEVVNATFDEQVLKDLLKQPVSLKPSNRGVGPLPGQLAPPEEHIPSDTRASLLKLAELVGCHAVQSLKITAAGKPGSVQVEAYYDGPSASTGSVESAADEVRAEISNRIEARVAKSKAEVHAAQMREKSLAAALRIAR